jgi:hypothetical protein
MSLYLRGSGKEGRRKIITYVASRKTGGLPVPPGTRMLSLANVMVQNFGIVTPCIILKIKKHCV